MIRVNAIGDAARTVSGSLWLTELRAHTMSEKSLIRRRDGAALFLKRSSDPAESLISLSRARMAIGDLIISAKTAARDPQAYARLNSPLQFSVYRRPAYKLLPQDKANEEEIDRVNSSPVVQVEYSGEKLRSMQHLAGTAAVRLSHLTEKEGRPPYVVGYTYKEMARVAMRVFGFSIADYDLSEVTPEARQDMELSFRIFDDFNPLHSGKSRTFLPKAIYAPTDLLLTRLQGLAEK